MTSVRLNCLITLIKIKGKHVKKIVISALVCASLVATNAMAEDSEFYVGLDVFSSNNTFTLENSVTGASADVDVDSDGFKLKFGATLNEGWRVQGYYQHETYDETLYDATNDVLNEIGVDVIKGFEVTSEFSPFIQAGLGYGWMDVEGYSDDTVNEVSLKLGAGVMYKITPTFEAIAGIDFQYRNWSDLQIGSTTIEIDEKITKFYIGANIHF